MKKGVALCILFSVFCLIASGCGPAWKKKFIRKGKTAKVAQPVLVLQDDLHALQPPSVRYQEHYAYWKSWHTDLLDSFGQIRKRDIRYLSGAIGELRAMQALLTGPSAQRLQEILSRLNDLQEKWERAPEPWHPSVTARTTLERLRRQIDREFHFSNVQDALSGP